MGQFKPMVKMMTTEPSVELKLKKGGHVSMKRGGGSHGHKSMKQVEHKMDGGAMGAIAGSPMIAPPATAVPTAMRAMARKRMNPTQGLGNGPMPVRGRVMKEGGESKSEHKAEMKKMAATSKELKKHESMPASKAHKGLKTGGVAMGQGGFKEGGIIKSTKGETKMVTASGGSSTPKKTGDVKMGNAGGFKSGGKASKYAKGGGVEGNVSSTPAGATNTTTGEVKLGNAGGFKKGGASKKHFATGGAVNDSGHSVAMPKKPPSKPVAISQLSGTFKKGGQVC